MNTLPKDIEEITIGQARKIAEMISGNPSAPTGLAARHVGQYVLVRSRNEGINAGFVAAADETGIRLIEARRLWYHRPANPDVSWYEGVSQTGVSADSKISCPVEEKTIVEDYSITTCTDEAAASIRAAKSHEQN